MGSPIFHFNNVDAPDYIPPCGKEYSIRQLAILNGDIPLSEVRLNELTILQRKAQNLQDFINYEIAQSLYTKKLSGDDYFPTYSIDEAKAILQRLTPWKIEW